MQLNGAQILLECLKQEGVELIFGYPGGVILDIYDLLPETDIRHVLVRHEQAAVHAADGYARACGRVGVALVTSGPEAKVCCSSLNLLWSAVERSTIGVGFRISGAVSARLGVMNASAAIAASACVMNFMSPPPRVRTRDLLCRQTTQS